MLSRYLKLCLSISILLSAIILISIVKSKLAFSKDLKISNRVVQAANLNKTNKPLKNTYHLKKEAKLQTLNNVTFLLNGQALSFNCELYEKAQRYYLPLEQVIYSLGGTLYEDNTKINISYDDINYIINVNDLTFKIQDSIPIKLRGEIILKNNLTYLSISDIENIFNLEDKWDYSQKYISIFKGKKNLKVKNVSSSGIVALIRLEDVAAGEIMTNSENLERMKVLADYLYSEGIKFNIAWIPRYKNPGKGIDNNLLVVNNMENAQFINMLDHMIFRGGAIGLHGYTHQHNNETSIISSELSDKFNNDAESTKKIVESAIETANTLNIPISFFETPHYSATQLQQSVIENYFDYIYEPYVGLWNKKPVVSLRNKSTIYVPAPLSYVKGNNADELIDRIKNRPTETLTSFFYHPGKEFDFIKFYTDEDGYVSYTYSEESPIHKIVKTLKDTGYVTINVDEIK